MIFIADTRFIITIVTHNDTFIFYCAFSPYLNRDVEKWNNEAGYLEIKINIFAIHTANNLIWVAHPITITIRCNASGGRDSVGTGFSSFEQTPTCWWTHRFSPPELCSSLSPASIPRLHRRSRKSKVQRPPFENALACERILSPLLLSREETYRSS